MDIYLASCENSDFWDKQYQNHVVIDSFYFLLWSPLVNKLKGDYKIYSGCHGALLLFGYNTPYSA